MFLKYKVFILIKNECWIKCWSDDGEMRYLKKKPNNNLAYS